LQLVNLNFFNCNSVKSIKPQIIDPIAAAIAIGSSNCNCNSVNSIKPQIPQTIDPIAVAIAKAINCNSVISIKPQIIDPIASIKSSKKARKCPPGDGVHLIRRPNSNWLYSRFSVFAQ